MALDQNDGRFAAREVTRERLFHEVWDRQLDDVFADVASYYDRANLVASLGLWNWMQNRFINTIKVHGSRKILDVCAGTNAIGIGLLQREPGLDVYSIDRSMPMLAQGNRVAVKQGLNINNIHGDAHRLPFPDNQFDVVTLQYASRHLRVTVAFNEIKRVLKPGGYFYHSDMLRPRNRLLGFLYRSYLRASLHVTAFFFGSGPAARRCKDYFVRTLHLFYSAGELSELLGALGFEDISSHTLLGGMVGFHQAVKTE